MGKVISVISFEGDRSQHVSHMRRAHERQETKQIGKVFPKKPILAEKSFGEGLRGRGRQSEKQGGKNRLIK